MNEQQLEAIKTAARNVFVIAFGIIVYFLAGVEIAEVTFGGLRAPAKYPEVLRFAAVAGMLWFWWRYYVVWKPFRHNYLQNLEVDIRRHPEFLDFLGQYLRDNHEARYRQFQRALSPPNTWKLSNNQQFSRFSRYKLTAKTLKIDSGGPSQGYRWPDADTAPLVVNIPKWIYWNLYLRLSVVRALSHSDFADFMLPHLVVLTALSFIILSWFGFDASGVFGLLTP